MTVKEGQAAAPAAQPVTLVSFDVDGTLIHSVGPDANRLHKEAFSAAFLEVFGLDTNIDVIPHHGGTDPLIALAVLQHCGVPRAEAEARLKAVEAAMARHFAAHAAQRAGLGLALLPGVRALLEALAARGDRVVTCLVTGNLEPIGWGKMRALGLEHLFSQPPFGGFGSDVCSGNTAEMWRDRAEFVKLAGERAAARFPGGVQARYHVGDTPADVRAALAAGAVAVGVTTGVCSRAELEAAAAGAPPGRLAVLESLADLPAVLKVLQLDSSAADAHPQAAARLAQQQRAPVLGRSSPPDRQTRRRRAALGEPAAPSPTAGGHTGPTMGQRRRSAQLAALALWLCLQASCLHARPGSLGARRARRLAQVQLLAGCDGSWAATPVTASDYASPARAAAAAAAGGRPRGPGEDDDAVLLPKGATAIPRPRRRSPSGLPAASSGAEDAVATPASICPSDPPFVPTSPSRTTCRLFVNFRTGGSISSYLCTAWFMGPRHVVSAGHCVASEGRYMLDVDDPGMMCCNFKNATACRRPASWRIKRWVTSVGFLANNMETNDGSVLEVEPYMETGYQPGEPSEIRSFYPRPVPEHKAYLDGYPGNDASDTGCTGNNITRRYFTAARVAPTNPSGGVDGRPVDLQLAGCMGESGGRVMRGGPRGTVYGLQTYGFTICIDGRGSSGVTQVTTTATACGVCLPCLQAAVSPPAADAGSPSPSPAPASPSPAPPAARSAAAVVTEASAAPRPGGGLSRAPWRAPPEPDVLAALEALPRNGGGGARSGAAAPASVCPEDPPFEAAPPSNTTCRLFVNFQRAGPALCTAWFVSPQHVVTAGHCVAERGHYKLDPRSPGSLCCGFDASSRACLPGRRFRLRAWITTAGWLEGLASANDGAVIRVEPWLPPRAGAGAGAPRAEAVAPVPQALGSIFPAVVPPGELYLDGFPARTWDDRGCFVGVDEQRRYATAARAAPLNAHGGAGGLPVAYALSGCMGESGGRVLLGGEDGPAFGIQTFGANDCVGQGAGRGLTGVTQIVDADGECGVCVACLVAALG
ncbi:hypothetical protein HT031_006323 [Scenedesmus sp. PABB004]|nr:hypothetical protein HT031_006323 [Scenedesmus sp. PABB004]